MAKKTVSRRDFVKATALGGSAMVLAACAAPAAPEVVAPAAPEVVAPAATAAPAEPVAEPTKRTIGENDVDAITFWTPGGSARYCQSFGDISAAFMSKNPGIKVGGAQCGAGEQNFMEIFLARVAAGNPPDVSIIWDSPASLGVRGALEPLDELMNASTNSQATNWPEGVLSSCQFNGKTYGLPVSASAYSMYFVPKIFESKGIKMTRADFPKTWDELRKLSKEFTVWEGDKLTSVGYLPSSPDMVQMHIWSALNGGGFYDPAAQKHTLDSEQNVEMMSFLLDWFNEEYKGDLTAVSNSGAWGFYPGDGIPGAFTQGRMAMASDGFWVAGDMYGGQEVTAEANTWDVAQYPVGPSGSGTKSGYWPNWLVLPKGSKRAAEGFKYMDFLVVDGMKIWFDAVPDMPGNKKVDTSSFVPQVVAENRSTDFAKDVMKFYIGQLAVATPMWNSPVQAFANDQITRMMEQVYTKKASPRDALSEAQKAVQAELDKLLITG